MANLYTYRGSVYYDQKPYRLKLQVAAGSSQTIERGEICEVSGSNMTPITGDDAFTSELAICDEEITSSHLAGFYWFIIPRPGDLFEYELSAAGNPSRGADLYWNTSQKLATSGSNAFANVVDHSGFPAKQGDASVGDVADRGTTVNNATFVICSFIQSTSYFNLIHG